MSGKRDVASAREALALVRETARSVSVSTGTSLGGPLACLANLAVPRRELALALKLLSFRGEAAALVHTATMPRDRAPAVGGLLDVVPDGEELLKPDVLLDELHERSGKILGAHIGGSRRAF